MPRPHVLRSAGAAQSVGSRIATRNVPVKCMANPRRQAKVAKQIEREVGNLLLTDKVLQKAVCPEKRIGIDSAVSAIASVTEVSVSGDLTIAKVYLSIFSDEEGKNIAISGLKKLQGYVRKHIATSMNLRMAPEVRFLQDDTIERAEQVYALLDRVKAERQDHEVADVSQHQGNQAASPINNTISDFENHSQDGMNHDMSLDDEGDVATLQLDAIDGDTSPEQKLPSVRKVRLPGASQRTSTLKLRKRS